MEAMDPNNKSEVFNTLYAILAIKKASKKKFEVNGRVRIAKNRMIFQKAEVQEWSSEIYR